MKTKAFAYLRVSGRGQIDGDGFPRQLAEFRGATKPSQYHATDIDKRLEELLLGKKVRAEMLAKLDKPSPGLPTKIVIQ